MLKNFLLLAFLLTGLSAVAQKTVFSYQTDVAKSPKNPVCESIVVPDERTGKTTIILKGNDNVEYLLINQKYEIEAIVRPSNGFASTIFGTGYSRYLTGVRNNKGSCFFYAIDRTHINMETVDFKNNTVVNNQVLEIPNEEHTIQGFTCNGRFYLLSANDKRRELILYLVDENGKVSHKNIPIDLSGFNPDKLTVSEYFSYSHVFYPWQETELIEATDLTKVYPYSDRTVIIVGNDKEPPHVWTIDLQTYNVSKKKFDLSGFSGFAGKKEKFYNNTYLYGENLYVLNASRQKIEIGVFNFNSGQLIQKHEITGSSNMQFVETPVKIMTNSSTSKENIIESNRELIKEMFKGSTGIALARNSNGQVILTCGVYDKETGIVSPGAFNPMITYSNLSSFRYYKERTRPYSFTRTVNFKIMLDSSDFKLARTGDKMSTIDKINRFLKSLPRETQAITTFIINNNYYLGYYSPKERTFVIKEMEK